MLSIHYKYKEDWRYNKETDDVEIIENFEEDAILETEEIKPFVRLVALLDKNNDLHYWKEEFLCGVGWFHWDHLCGFVAHEEMISCNI